MTSVPVPQCYGCVHSDDAVICEAFPQGIPEDILASQFDHRQPHDGDQGIQFDQAPDRPEPDWEELFPSTESPGSSPELGDIGPG